jgi:dynein heavy chain
MCEIMHFQAINEEEQLLDFEPSPFLVLQAMLSIAEPLDRLWHIVYNFHINYDKWYYGKLNFVEYVTLSL